MKLLRQMGSLRGESKRGEGEPELWGQLTLGSQVGKERLVGASAGATAARGTAGAMGIHIKWNIQFSRSVVSDSL